MGGVPCPDSRVQIKQTTKQVAVQRCGFTSDLKIRSKAACTRTHPKVNKSRMLSFKDRRIGELGLRSKCRSDGKVTIR